MSSDEDITQGAASTPKKQKVLVVDNSGEVQIDTMARARRRNKGTAMMATVAGMAMVTNNLDFMGNRRVQPQPEYPGKGYTTNCRPAPDGDKRKARRLRQIAKGMIQVTE